MLKNDIAVIGLAVMGQNLVLNMENKGFRVAVYNRTAARTEEFIKTRGKGKKIYPAYSLEELIASLKPPRKVMLMVKAGQAVDKIIAGLVPYLKAGDIIIDGGNSHFTDTNRRSENLAKHGIRYLGTGISGGEYGALHGPSIMPGGDKKAYEEVKEILTAIAARTEDGPCVTYLGPGASGHYVKMVHNGIEYALMELIAEVYDLLRKVWGLKAIEMSRLLAEWNKVQASYLLEITSKILSWEDKEGAGPLIDFILDQAKQKGTGKWSVQDALELGVPIPTITAAVNARFLSAFKEERQDLAKIFPAKEMEVQRDKNLAELEDALYLATIIAYAEGMKLLEEASREYDYALNLAEVAGIWQNGCIIRSRLLKDIQQVYQREETLLNLIAAAEFQDLFQEKIGALRRTVNLARKAGIPVPALSAALDYFDSLRSAELPANLIQAQRDYFGAHNYQRKDKEGFFHTEWQDIHNI